MIPARSVISSGQGSQEDRPPSRERRGFLVPDQVPGGRPKFGTGAWDRQRRPSEVRVDRVLRLDPADVRREGAALPRDRFDEVVAEVRRELLAARSAVAGLIRDRAAWMLPERWRRPGSFSRPQTTPPLPAPVALAAAADEPAGTRAGPLHG